MKPRINIGYVSLLTLFLLTMLLIIGGFYGWQKYEEYKYPEKVARGEIRGIQYYFDQIGMKINEIMAKNDVRNKRAMELAEESKRINDKANLYSLEVPNSWMLISNTVNQDNKLSILTLQSSYFAAHESAGKKFIDAGAKFTSSVVSGENKSLTEGNGGHINLIKIGKDRGESGEYAYHIFKDPDFQNSEVIEAHFVRNGKTYSFTMAYNPRNFSDVEYTFNEIMHSVEFLK